MAGRSHEIKLEALESSNPQTALQLWLSISPLEGLDQNADPSMAEFPDPIGDWTSLNTYSRELMVVESTTSSSVTGRGS